ncbi:MAG: efflux RND transporter periplasmic adaptor subunit [Polyangiaceae bacterium]
MKKALVWIVPLIAVVAAAIVYFTFWGGEKAPEIEYRTAAVERKRIVGRVTASGALQAVVTVQVGSQVSGRVQKLFADFNSTVTKGQLIAKIDPQLFQAAVEQASANNRAARAGVAQASAQAKNADRQLERIRELHKQGLATQVELDAAETAADVARAQVDSAKAQVDQTRASLNRAKVDLSYTDILSPIDGVVISRDVDVGQTVAASLQAPVIFTIAEDLRKMQVNTSVSEGDVGRLAAGMAAMFTVDAFSGQRFRGTIAQIRNAAQTVQNVVTYNAVIDVANDDLKLRPGMTANVTIIYAERDNVIAVPNQALRFRAPPELAGTAAASASGPGSGSGRGRWRDRGGATAEPPARDRNGMSSHRTLWVMRQGKATEVSVQIGLTDGTSTEITGGDLKEGDEVVLEATVKGGSDSGGNKAPSRGLGQPSRMRF